MSADAGADKCNTSGNLQSANLGFFSHVPRYTVLYGGQSVEQSFGTPRKGIVVSQSESQCECDQVYEDLARTRQVRSGWSVLDLAPLRYPKPCSVTP
jgi:hypothetical protein